MVILTSEKLFRFSNNILYNFGVSKYNFVNSNISEAQHDIYSYKRILSKYGQESKKYIFSNLFLCINPYIFKDGAYLLSDESKDRFGVFKKISKNSILSEINNSNFNYIESLKEIDKSGRPLIWNMWRNGEISKVLICHIYKNNQDIFNNIPEYNPIIKTFKKVIEFSATKTKIISELIKCQE